MSGFNHWKRASSPARAAAMALAGLVLLAPGVALADVSVTAQADKAAVQAGDTVEVTITVEGEGMAVAEGLYTYDPSLLTYAESEGGASDGFLNLVSAEKGGADTLTCRIRFTAAGAGEAKVEAAIDKVLGYDGKEQAGAKATASVSVAAAAPTPTPTPIDYAAEGVAAQNVQGAAEPMYIWRSLENVTVPSRYGETTLEYHGETVAAATVEDSDAPTLLYLSNATGETGGYYIYDAAKDSLYPYRTLSSVSKSYILLEPDGSVELPAGFSETTLTIDEKDYKAWKAQDAQGDVYLLYARNPDGEVGYYLYNPQDEAFQRYAVLPARPPQPTPAPAPAATPAAPQEAPGEEPAPGGGVTLTMPQVYMALGGALLLVLIIVGLIVAHAVEKARRRRRAAQRKAERQRRERELKG